MTEGSEPNPDELAARIAEDAEAVHAMPTPQEGAVAERLAKDPDAFKIDVADLDSVISEDDVVYDMPKTSSSERNPEESSQLEDIADEAGEHAVATHVDLEEVQQPEHEENHEREKAPGITDKLADAAIIRAQGHHDGGLASAIKYVRENGYLGFREGGFHIGTIFEANGIMAVGEASDSDEPKVINIGETSPVQSPIRLLERMGISPDELKPTVTRQFKRDSRYGENGVDETTTTWTLPNGVNLVEVFRSRSYWSNNQWQRSVHGFAFVEKPSSDEVETEVDQDKMAKLFDVSDVVAHAKAVIEADGVDVASNGRDRGEYVDGTQKSAEATESMAGSKWDKDLVFTYLENRDGDIVKITQKPNAPQGWEPILDTHKFSPKNQARAAELLQSMADKQGRRKFEGFYGGPGVRQKNIKWAESILAAVEEAEL